MRRYWMSGRTGRVLLAAAWCAASLGDTAVRAAAPANLQRDGSLEIAGRKLRCAGVRNRLDSRLPNIGVAVPDEALLVLNPSLLDREPELVRLFVFFHECGHHQVGGSELKADCWAVERGVEEGWLDKPGLAQVCTSFGDAPQSATHPSGKRRCANLDQCFAQAVRSPGRRPLPPLDAALPKEIAALLASSAAPQLVSGPKLIRTGLLR